MATIKFRLSSKSDRDTGHSEVLVRFFHGRVLDQYAKTNIFGPSDSWDEKTGKFYQKNKKSYDKKLSKELSSLNVKLEQLKQYIQDSFIEAGAGKVQLPYNWLVNLIQEYNFPTVEEPKGVLELMLKFNDERETSTSNRNHFLVCWRAFNRFLVYKNYGINTPISDVSGEMIREFLDFLREEHTLVEVSKKPGSKSEIEFLDSRYKKAFLAVPEAKAPKMRGQNTICEFVKHLRTFFLWAIEQGVTTINPLIHLAVPQPLYGTPYYITIEERNILYNTDLSDRPRLEQQRDIFVFQCVIGCRVSDLRNLTKDSIINGAIEYIPRKTKEGRPLTVRVPLNAIAQAIVDKYKDNPGKALLPCITDQQYNYAIKEVFKICGLTRPVTVLNPTTRQEEKRPLNEVASSHLARRCFIGNLYKQVKDPNLIGKLSGHIEGSRAFARYRDIDEEMRKELVTMLE